MLMAASTPARRGGAGADGLVRGRRRGSAPVESVARPVGVGHRQIADIQRARIISAMLDSSIDRGAGSVSVAHVVERSGVSRRTFYELFADREDCFHAAFEQALACACEQIAPAYLEEKSWRERVRAGLTALLCFFDAEPQIGRVLLNESLAGGPQTLERRDEVIAQLTAIVEEGAAETNNGVAPPTLTGEGIVGGVLAVIQRRLIEGPHTQLVDLTNPLMSMIVLPYLGTSVARRELKRAAPAPVEQTSRHTRSEDPFKSAGIRLTYRTVRVLMAIAEHPGASNRLIGDSAEMKDQGQVSKLLARLQRAGMVTNAGLGPARGAPNAWTLTASGRQVTNNVGTHTEGMASWVHVG